MITTKEKIFQIPIEGTSVDDKRAAHIAGSLAENLSDGEYLLSMLPNMVLFIRVDDWHPDIEIEKIDFDTNYTIKLSNDRIIDFHSEQINNALNRNQDSYRITLLSDEGFSAFKILVDD